MTERPGLFVPIRKAKKEIALPQDKSAQYNGGDGTGSTASAAAALRTSGRMELGPALELMGQVAKALDNAHAEGIVHGTLNPSRISVDADGQVKVLDLQTGRRPADTPSAELGAAVEYLSPEFLRGEPVTAESDQFSLAAIFCRVLSGSTPFAADSAVKSLYRILFLNLEASSFRDIPGELRAPLSRALSKLPQGRFSSCVVFVRSLEEAAFRPASSPTRFEGFSTGPLQEPQAPPMAPLVGGPKVAAPKISGDGSRTDARRLVLMCGAVGVFILTLAWYLLSPRPVAPVELQKTGARHSEQPNAMPKNTAQENGGAREQEILLRAAREVGRTNSSKKSEPKSAVRKASPKEPDVKLMMVEPKVPQP